jgi:hypothetical protein
MLGYALLYGEDGELGPELGFPNYHKSDWEQRNAVAILCEKHHGYINTLGDYKSASRDGACLSVYNIIPASNEQSPHLGLLSRSRRQR